MLGWALALGGIVPLSWLAYRFVTNPAQAKALSGHAPQQFDQVMAGRYGFMAALLLGAALKGDGFVLAFLFAALSGLGFYDALVYARAEKPFQRHLQAGVLSALAALALVGIGAYG